MVVRFSAGLWRYYIQPLDILIDHAQLSRARVAKRFALLEKIGFFKKDFKKGKKLF